MWRRFFEFFWLVEFTHNFFFYFILPKLSTEVELITSRKLERRWSYLSQDSLTRFFEATCKNAETTVLRILDRAVTHYFLPLRAASRLALKQTPCIYIFF